MKVFVVFDPLTERPIGVAGTEKGADRIIIRAKQKEKEQGLDDRISYHFDYEEFELEE